MILKKNDQVRVLQSPGAPFDIGEIFTVAEIIESTLPIKVEERPYRFDATWLERVVRGRKVPGPSLEVINDHEVVKGKCVNCGMTDTSTKCKGASA